MPLLNDFYTIDAMQQDGGRATFHISLHADHAIFKGHFPGNPIVPGVCQLAIAEELASRLLGEKLQMARLSNIKYLNVWTPDEAPSIDVVLSAVKPLDNGRTSLKAELSVQGKVYSKMSMELAKPYIDAE